VPREPVLATVPSPLPPFRALCNIGNENVSSFGLRGTVASAAAAAAAAAVVTSIT